MSQSHLTVSNKLVIPVSANVSKVSPAQEGAVVYDKTSGLIYVSNGREWIASSPSFSSQSSQSSSEEDRAITNDIMANSVTVFKKFTLPVVQNVSTTPLLSLGSMVYNKATDGVFISEPTGWVSAGGGAVNSVTAANTTIVIGGTATNPTIAGGYVAGTNISIVGNTISSTASAGVNSVTAANTTIVIGGTASNPTVAGGYVAGTGISIVGNTITATGVVGSVISVTAGNNTVVVDNTDPANPVVTGNYVGGAGISVTGNTIANTGVVTLTAANTTVVVGGTSSNPTIAGNYVAGAGISITTNSIANTGVLTVAAANTTVVVGGTATNPTVAGNYVAGSGISIVGNTISATASAPKAIFSTAFYNDTLSNMYIGTPAGSGLAVNYFPYLGSSVVSITSFAVVLSRDLVTSTPAGTIRLIDPNTTLTIATITYPDTIPVAPNTAVLSTTTISNLPVAATPLYVYVDPPAGSGDVYLYSILVS